MWFVDEGRSKLTVLPACLDFLPRLPVLGSMLDMEGRLGFNEDRRFLAKGFNFNEPPPEPPRPVGN
jgi:hypothetical protein